MEGEEVEVKRGKRHWGKGIGEKGEEVREEAGIGAGEAGIGAEEKD